MPPRRRHLILFAALILTFLIGGSTLFALATQDNDFLLKAHDPSQVLLKIRLAERKGALVRLDNEGLNQLLAVFAPRITKNLPLPGLEIKGLNGTMKDTLVTLYAPASYRGVSLLLSATGRLSYSDERISFQPETLKVGNLTIPTRLALGIISRYQSGGLTASSKALTLSKTIAPFAFSTLTVREGELAIYVEPFITLATAPIKPSAPPATTPTPAPSGSSTYPTIPQVPSVAPASPTPPAPPTVPPATAPTQPPSSTSAPAQTPPTTSNPSPPSTPAPPQSPPTKPSTDTTTAQNLTRLHSQLNSVAAEMSTAGQRQVIGMIQSSIGATIADPTHNFKPEAEQVKKLYYKLTNDERTAIKVSLLTNIDAQLILELRTTYGL